MAEKKFGSRNCLETLAGVFLPPVLLCCRKECNCCSMFLCILLTILGIIPGSIYAFMKTGLPCCTATLCWLLPPVAVCCHGTCYQGIICLLLTLTWFGGVWYAFCTI